MTDRELLEAAARAAGIKGAYWLPLDDGICVPDGQYESEPYHTFWNPLTDDGDALRLAVKRGLQVECNLERKKSGARNLGSMYVYSEDHGDDPNAATRRAIVRAAAAMGAKA